MLIQDYLRDHCMDEIVVIDTFVNEWNRQLERWNLRRKLRMQKKPTMSDVSVMKRYTVWPARIIKWY